MCEPPPTNALSGLTSPAKKISPAEGVKVLKAALEQGANFWNGVSVNQTT